MLNKQYESITCFGLQVVNYKAGVCGNNTIPRNQMTGIIESLALVSHGELVSQSTVGAVLPPNAGTDWEHAAVERSTPISIWDDAKVQKYICSKDGWKK